MRLTAKIKRLLANLVGRDRLETTLDAELRGYLEEVMERKIRQGILPAEARRQALLEAGGLDQVKEQVRDTWLGTGIETTIRDIRYAVRTLVRSPGFTATAVLSLTLGIGASAAIFSLFDQVLLRLLPVREPEQLVLLDWKGTTLTGGWGTGNLMPYPLFRDLQEQTTQVFDGVFCRHPTEVMLSTGQQPHPVWAEIISGSYFPALGVRPELGRLIDESDNLQPGAHPVIVLSYDYWKNNLGGAPDIVGRKVLLNNHPMTVIGVAAAGFHGMDIGEVPALWIPAMMKRQATPNWDHLMNRRVRWMHVFGRLRPGVSAEQGKAGLEPWFKSMLEQETRREGFPTVGDEHRRRFLASTLDVIPAPQGRSDFRRKMGQPLTVMMIGTLLLLTLACVNVANLLLARANARNREVTTRIALGASQGRIMSQLLVDGLLIALAGGALGLVTAPAISQILISFLPQSSAGLDLSARIDARVFLFAFLAITVAGCLCGLAPASQLRRASLITSLRDRSVTAASGVRVRKLLVIFQIAFTVILLVGAGLFVQTLTQLYAKGPGFDASSLLMFSVNPLRVGYTAANAREVIRDLLPKLQQTPGVESAAAASHDLLAGGSWGDILTIELNGRTVTDRGVIGMWVSPGFFSTVGAKIIMGRDFNDQEPENPGTDARSRSAIVNERFTRRYFGDRSPIGYRVGHGDRPNTRTNIEIVGVVKDFSYLNLREEREHVFFPFRESPAGTFYVKARGKAESTFASIRAAVAQIDPALPLLSLRTVEDQMDQSLMTERMLASLSSGFGAIALLLSVVGLYGVISFVAAHRTQEIGIRMALGATRRSAVWLIARDALLMIGAGIAVALPCVWALSRFVEAQLFGVRAVDGPTIAAASALLALVALGAATLPAWRAASVSPTQALRYE